MSLITANELKNLFVPKSDSHKGQNGRLLLIGGSHLFHAASLWSLKVASRIVDLVHFSSVPENNEIVSRAKAEFRDGIVVPRADIESYIDEDDCILIGPGMTRAESSRISNIKSQISNLSELDAIADEGVQTAMMTNYLLKKYPHKQWVIDAGALQMMDIELIPKRAILTPHHGEFDVLWEKVRSSQFAAGSKTELSLENKIHYFAEKFNCIVLVKGVVDYVSDGKEISEISGGNIGMTKGGTGDVLAGLIAALACKNDPLRATIAGSFINKKAGDALFKRVGPYFNASDLADGIPKVMKTILMYN